jgi:hypothetical protein
MSEYTEREMRLIRERDDALATGDRLRALIKAQEWGSDAHGDPACPWCPALRIDHAHLPTCPAFTPEGEVR